MGYRSDMYEWELDLMMAIRNYLNMYSEVIRINEFTTIETK